MSDIWSVLQARIRTSGAQPLVTYLDPGSGERTELSATSLGNAAAKIANALRDEYELDPGDRLMLDLPLHWQRSAWCAGAWTAGCVVTDRAADAALVVTTVDRAAAQLAAQRTAAVDVPTVVVSLHPFGMPVTEDLPTGVTDATLAVRQQPDAYLFEPPTTDLAALELDDRCWTHGQLLADAGAMAVSPAGCTAVTMSADPTRQLLAGLPLPLATDGSAVLVAGSHLPDTIRDQERITAALTS